ncbi:MAG TPA: DUF692 domain-containing protein [Longimicrobium sp.]|nr:DUF692 domain-containing protein [Longimicrobium sp.]
MSVSELSPSPAAERLAALPRLGVGVLYNPSLREFVRDHAEALDYLAIIPDRAWQDEGPGAPVRFIEADAQVEILDRAAERLAIVGHSVGLSIGSADPLDSGHVEQVARWQARYGMPWHSDHLSFVRLPGVDAHTELSPGMALPVPYDHEVLEMLVERVDAVQARIPVPFLLENNVYYVDLPEQEMTEPEFLNALTRRTGCGLLLDVHNVVVNATNHGFDARGFIFALDLERVVELHIAGGSELEGLYTDSHAGPVAERVWELLPDVVAACPNLCAITFEFHEGWYPAMGAEGVLRELRTARDVWDRHHAAAG